MDPFHRWSFLLRSVQKAWRRCWPTFSLVLPTPAVERTVRFRWMSCDVSSPELCYRIILMLRSLKKQWKYKLSCPNACRFSEIRFVLCDLRCSRRCWWRYDNITECDAVFKASKYWGMWRSLDGYITFLRNMTHRLRYHSIEECDALDKYITVLRNMTLCLKHHNIEECGALFINVLQYYGIWRSV